MKKAIKWMGVIAVSAFVILGIIGSGMEGKENSASTTSEQQSNKNEKTEPATAEAKIYAVNDLISSESMEVVVTSIDQRDAVGKDFLEEKASEGATLVVVQWQYKNTSNKPLKSYDNPEIKLFDANNVEYGSDLGKTSTHATEVDLDRKVWSDLNPGITVKDAAVFEVGKESFANGGWYLNIEADDEDYKVAL